MAADLHDGAVQRLAGVSLSLAAAARQNGAADNGAALHQAVAGAAAETRETIRELRALLVDIYPPTLQRSGLVAALNDLVAPLRAAGISVALRVPETVELPDDIEALFYRVAQEAIRNARTHSDAGVLRSAWRQTRPKRCCPSWTTASASPKNRMMSGSNGALRAAADA